MTARQVAQPLTKRPALVLAITIGQKGRDYDEVPQVFCHHTSTVTEASDVGRQSGVV